MSDICVRLVRFEDKYNPHICTSSDLEVEAAAAIDALREENARLQGLLREAHVKMEANNLWSNLRHRVAATIREGGKVKAEAACPAPDEAP